jgi:hypothetical protein
MASPAEVPRAAGGGNGAGANSSSPELSSPPVLSDTEAAPSPSPTPNNPQQSNKSIAVDTSGGALSRNDGGGNTPASATKSGRGTSHTAVTMTPQPTTRKPRKPREKKEKDPANNPDAPPIKETKTRKPRGSGVTARKRQKVEPEPEPEPKPAVSPVAARQSKITEMVAPPPAQPPPQSFDVSATTEPAQNGNREGIANSTPAFQTSAPPPQPPPAAAPVPAPAPPPARSSGQNYDPIRSANIETASTSHSSYHPFSPPQAPSNTPPRSQYRASASPAISSIIDPPSQPANPVSTLNPPLFTHISKTSETPLSESMNAASTNVHSGGLLSSAYQPSIQQSSLQPSPPTSNQTPIVIDAENPAMAKPSVPTKKSGGTSTGPPSSAASPKPARQKEAPPPIPSGSGLLSSSLFGRVDESASATTQAPSIIIHVPLNGEVNKVINFAQLAEQKYGFAALHPRLAAQKERMARIAAASAALEKTAGSKGGTSIEDSGDELDNMSVDNSEDPERPDRDVAMGGTSGADESRPEGVKQRRKRKVEDYDRDDPFVDDTEMAWEEQAAASKDGFFVYSGPLVPEGEKPQVERYDTNPRFHAHSFAYFILMLSIPSADGTVKRGRGRGRGGGPGSRGGRGGGPGSRGGAATRKPRISKMQRANMEREKVDREKMAVLAAKPAGYPG